MAAIYDQRDDVLKTAVVPKEATIASAAIHQPHQVAGIDAPILKQRGQHRSDGVSATRTPVGERKNFSV